MSTYRDRGSFIFSTPTMTRMIFSNEMIQIMAFMPTENRLEVVINSLQDVGTSVKVEEPSIVIHEASCSDQMVGDNNPLNFIKDLLEGTVKMPHLHKHFVLEGEDGVLIGEDIAISYIDRELVHINFLPFKKSPPNLVAGINDLQMRFEEILLDARMTFENDDAATQALVGALSRMETRDSLLNK